MWQRAVGNISYAGISTVERIDWILEDPQDVLRGESGSHVDTGGGVCGRISHSDNGSKEIGRASAKFKTELVWRAYETYGFATYRGMVTVDGLGDGVYAFGQIGVGINLVGYADPGQIVYTSSKDFDGNLRTTSQRSVSVMMNTRSFGAATNSPPLMATKNFTYRWSLRNRFPGEIPTDPFPPDFGCAANGGGKKPQPIIPAAAATGRIETSFVAPVMESDLGHTREMYFAHEASDELDFQITEPNTFNSFVVPLETYGGDGSFQLLLEGNSYLLHPGQVFDFTMLKPTGVSAFRIEGLNPSFAHGSDDDNLAFVFGATFGTPGVALFTTTNAVPEPSTHVLIGAAFVAAVTFRREGRVRSIK
jgi:hypothetical protein